MLDELYGASYFTKLDLRVRYHRESEYFGNIITSQGVKVDDSYYCKFVRNYGVIPLPLTNFLKKCQFGWSDDSKSVFLAFKHAMTTTPILAMPNFNDSFTIEIDASGEGIGYVLTQESNEFQLESMEAALVVTHSDNEEEGGKGADSMLDDLVTDSG
nr:uncharacterized protein LOC118031233 [Populus alba]